MRASFLTISLSILLLSFSIARGAVPAKVSVMTGEQVIQILDETVDWYRTLGTQQQSANQPSDLLIIYANRQAADQVVSLAFDLARANAELLSSEAGAEQVVTDVGASAQSLSQTRQSLNEKINALNQEIAANQKKQAASSGKQKGDFQERAKELQSEVDLLKARANLIGTMSEFVAQNDAKGSGVNALKGQIDAIANSIPSLAHPPAMAAPAAARAPAASDEAPTLAAPATAPSRFGIWDLGANVLRLLDKLHTIDAVDKRTAALQATFAQVRAKPLEQLKSLSTQGDALSNRADAASAADLKLVRDRFDTTAWLFKQTSAILIPLSQGSLLLGQYRHNLKNWREGVEVQYHDAVIALAVRVAIFLGLVALALGLSEVWRRSVMRYVHDPKRRYRLLLLRKIVFWTLVIIIVGATFLTEISSFATFAGLITAGVAVAMQSILVSVVGYFFLIGKYGIRVGDRVQVGSVTGEVIDLGLVRLHLMELGGQSQLVPTGRVVAFANSIVFQASGGLFKQIPGVDFAWHELTFTLPAGIDYEALKERLLGAVAQVVQGYREELLRQTREIQRTTESAWASDAEPQVQLQFTSSGVNAWIRYPVHVPEAAAIDERVSREVTHLIATAKPAA